MMLYATFEIVGAALGAPGTNETAALEQMLATVMGRAEAQFQYLAAGGNTTQMRVQARILAAAAPAAITSGCCTQYDFPDCRINWAKVPHDILNVDRSGGRNRFVRKQLHMPDCKVESSSI